MSDEKPKKKRKPLSEKPKQLGRPLEYTEEMGQRICELTATHSVGLKKLIEMYPDLPDDMTIQRWRYRVEKFRVSYAQAKIRQADLLAEECLQIADDSGRDNYINEEGKEVCNTEWINRARLRIDTRKWLAAKLLPKQYGALAEQAEQSKSSSDSLVEKIIDKLGK